MSTAALQAASSLASRRYQERQFVHGGRSGPWCGVAQLLPSFRSTLCSAFSYRRKLWRFFCSIAPASNVRIASVALYFLCGAIGTVIAVGCLTGLIGAPFLYFYGQLLKLTAVADNRSKWFLPLQAWVWVEPYLIMPVAVLVYSLSAIVRRTRTQPRLLAVCASNATAFLTFALLQAAHIWVLQFDEYVIALLPFTFLALGGCLAIMASRFDEKQEWVIASAVAAVAIAPWNYPRFVLLRHRQGALRVQSTKRYSLFSWFSSC